MSASPSQTKSRRPWLIGAALTIILVGGALMAFLWLKPRAVSLTDCDAVLAWTSQQSLEAGRVASLPLPAELGQLSRDGLVHAQRIADGRVCALLKTDIAHRDNFSGTLCCDRAFQPTDFYTSTGGSDAVSIGSGPPLEELFVRSRVDERRLTVYFDLN